MKPVWIAIDDSETNRMRWETAIGYVEIEIERSPYWKKEAWVMTCPKLCISNVVVCHSDFDLDEAGNRSLLYAFHVASGIRDTLKEAIMYS